MANDFDSNFSRKLMDKVLVPFETSRTLSKNINTQMFQGSFDVKSGENVDVKRPTDWDGSGTAEKPTSYVRLLHFPVLRTMQATVQCRRHLCSGMPRTT